MKLISSLNKTLEKHYHPNDTEVIKLHTAFLDIEVDFDPVKGFASEEAFMPITAIGVYLDWMDAMVCLAVPPKQSLGNKHKNLLKVCPRLSLFRDEAQMLKTFLDLIDDCDVLSGWNSEGYDIPIL